MRSDKALKNITSSFILQIVTIIYGFLVPRIIISTFGSNVNGLVASITQFLTYIALLESGFGPVVKSVLYKPIASNSKKDIENILKTSEKFFKRIAYVFILYVIILCVLYPMFVNTEFNSLYTASLIIIIALSTFAEYFFGMTYRLFLQADQKNYVISIIQIITYIISVIFIVALAKFGASIHIIKLISCMIFVFRPIIQNYYVKRKYSINLKEADDKFKLKQKWDGLAQHIAAVIHGNTDIAVLTVFCTLGDVSIYSVHYLVVNGVKLLIQSFSNGMDSLFGDMIAKNEINNLNKKFKLYEFLYLNITTIVFTCAILLITPFVSIYTAGISDVNYHRPLFALLLVISEFICMIRLPYISLVHAAGHFKETRIGAWVECFSNIVVSIILVQKYGLIGVAIGTIFAMSIRTIEFIYHSNKYILKRNIVCSLKYILSIICETIIIIVLYSYIPKFDNINFGYFLINGGLAFILSVIVIAIVNFVLFKSEMLECMKESVNIIRKYKK